jgi:hypothetical protein
MAATSDEPNTGADQHMLIDALENGRLFGTPVTDRIDTHAATIFLTTDRAWKIKRAVRYPYLDFSTPELRRAALTAELRYNRRTAPALYLAVHPIARTDSGFELDGRGATVDWVLEMQRFPDGALLADLVMVGPLGDALCGKLADHLYAFHRDAEVARGAIGGFDRLDSVIAGNAESLTPHDALFGKPRVDRLLAAQRALLARHREALDRRAREGKVRHVHGDLHLANIAMIDGRPTMFDCLEFDTDLATTDVLYDLAFLLMDLWHRDLRGDANRLYNRYFDLGAEDDASALLPLMMSLRATVRAHVAASTFVRTERKEARNDAHAFIALAEALLIDAPARLVAIGGLSGTGKSAVAREIGGDFLPAPGARILRSDVWRKHLAGAAPDQRLAPDYYTSAFSAVVYARLVAEASRLLAAGRSVIVDAVFADQAERAGIARLASMVDGRWHGLWLEAAEGIRLARVERRRNDVSDADVVVARKQSAIGTGALGDWIRLSAEGDLPAVAAAARIRLGLPAAAAAADMLPEMIQPKP